MRENLFFKTNGAAIEAGPNACLTGAKGFVALPLLGAMRDNCTAVTLL